MVVLWVILGIVIIAAMVAVIAGVADVISQRESSHKPYGPYEKYIKRPLDAFLATGALIVFSPILLTIAILVRVKLGSPVLFKQDRPGRNEKIFKLYKFRTMTDDRDENGELLPDEQRLTPFGKWLRSTSLDELPELVNITLGHLSICGPRPLLVEYLPYYTEKERHRHDVRPGLTGLAQVNGRNFLMWSERFTLDYEYVSKIVFTGDVKIILRTLKKVLSHADIATDGHYTMKNFDEERTKDENYQNK